MFETYFTAAIIVLMAIAMALELSKPPIIVFTALLMLIVGGVISVDEAFRGFSNKGMLAVAFLFIVGAAIRISGYFERVIHSLLGDYKKSMPSRYFRFLFPVAGFSAFLNNTPIVAALIPMIKSWAKKNNIAASKFLIPLSYAAILGGTCTLIGTSTNLIVHGLLIDHNQAGLTFFQITKVGVPVTIIMLLLLVLFGNRFLPSRKDIISRLDETKREFMSEVSVQTQYPHIGKSIEDAGLRHLPGLFLFQILRKKEFISPVSPREKIQLEDRLFFTGVAQTIYDISKTPGLTVIEDPEFDLKNLDSDKVKTYEAVISSDSPLIGQTVKESNFRQRYQAIILAVHRAGERINQKVGDIVFKPSDTLFILAKKGFYTKWYHSKNFSLVSSSFKIFEKPKWKGNLSLLFIFIMVTCAALNLVPIVLLAAITAVVMVISKIISFKEAKYAVNWDVLLVIASSFGIARALENSGLVEIVAEFMLNTTKTFGPVGILAGLFLLTSTFTLVMTNNAVAAIMFPVTLSVANSMNIGLEPFILVLVMGASTCFATPIGYQTNMMVYGTGGYKFRDFLKIGLLMNLLVGIITLTVIYVLFL